MNHSKSTLGAILLTVSLTTTALAGNIGGMRTSSVGNIGGMKNVSGNIGGMKSVSGNIGGLETETTDETVSITNSIVGNIGGLLRVLAATTTLF